jgi:RNA polymerase sigma-70 factor (ECF subfamily)
MIMTVEPSEPLATMEARIDAIVALRPRGYVLAVRMLGRADDAEDVVQKACLDAIRQLRDGLAPANVTAWFLTLVLNTARKHVRDEVRRRRKETAVEASRRSSGRPAPDADLIGVLGKGLAGLDEELRLSISLCYEQGLSQREAAEVLEIPERTLSRRVAEGLKRLHEMLTKAGYKAAPAAVIGALAHTAPPVPASLAAAVKGVACAGPAVPRTLRRAGSARGGGITMKIFAGVVIAGVLAGGYAAFGHRLQPSPTAAAPVPPVLSGPAKVEFSAFCLGREYIDGPAPEATCADHKIWTVDAKGNQYVTGVPTTAVRVITTDGMVRTIAGDDRYLPFTGVEEGPASMLPSSLGGAEAGHRGSGVSLSVKGFPLEGEDQGCLYTTMAGYPCRIFKNKEKGGRWWYRVVGKGAAPLPTKAGDSVAFKDANLKGVGLGGETFKVNGYLYSWDGENGKITCLLSPADYGDKCLHWKTGKGLGKAEQISMSEDGTMYVLYYGASYPHGQVFRISKDRSKVEEIVRSVPGGRDGPGLKTGYHCGPYNLQAYKDIVILASVDSNKVRRWKDGRVSTLCENDGEWREIYNVKGAKYRGVTAKGFACVPQLGCVYLFYPGEERGGGAGIYKFGPVDFLKPTVGPLVEGE